MFCDYSKLVTLYKIDEVHFRLFGTNDFHAKAKNERFTAAGSRCRLNLKNENFVSSFGRLRQKIVPKSVRHVQHDYFSSFNQSNHWYVALSLLSSFLKLAILDYLAGTQPSCSNPEWINPALAKSLFFITTTPVKCKLQDWGVSFKPAKFKPRLFFNRGLKLIVFWSTGSCIPN